MSKNEIPKSDEKLIDIFAELLSLDLYPDTVKEAEEIIKKTGINLQDFESRTTLIFREILSEFSDDWRNVSEDVIDAESAKLEEIKLKTNLSKEKLTEEIARLVQKISSKGQGKQLELGLAFRNVDKQTKDDLAQLLRQLEYAASELGIDIADE